jgi:hypothetical protein
MKSFSTLPQELYQSRPRSVRLSGAGRALAAASIVMCLAAPVVGVALQRQVVRERAAQEALLRAGVVTNGFVVRLKRDSKENKRGTVYYQFDAKGRTFESHVKIPIAQWRALRPGDTLPIRHLDDDPGVSVPDGVTPGVMPAVVPYVLAPVLLGIGLLLGALPTSQRRLLSDGRAVIGVITSVQKRRTQHGSYWKVKYEFPLLNGAKQTGSLDTRSPAAVAGSSIAVLYDIDRPRRSRPYPMPLVRLAQPD